MHRLQELVRLHRLGVPMRRVATQLRMSPNTERAYRQALARVGLLEGDVASLPELAELRAAVERELASETPKQHTSSISRWSVEVKRLLGAGNGPTAIFDYLRLEHEDFEGSIGAVKRMVTRLRKDEGPRAEDVVIPVTTAPGEVAQVDFGYVGRLWDRETGRMRKAYVFVMVLGYSRRMVVRVTFDQKVETWLRCHVEAFQELGGVPKVIVPDNLKAAVVRAAFGVDGAATLNRSYRELARSFGFQVDPTPIYSPEKKGKVESAVKYVKRSFFGPRADLVDVEQIRPKLQRWVEEIAAKRIHGTTREAPLARFEQERPHLLVLPSWKWEPVVWREAKVHRDTHVQVAHALYSVPWRWIGKTCLVRLTAHSVELYVDDVRVGTHARVAKGKRSTIESHLPEERRDHRHRSREHWEERAAAIDPAVGEYIREVFDADDVLYQLRTVIAMVTHLEGFPAERAVGAVRRARYYGLHKYAGLKEILKKALDLEPLPEASRPIEEPAAKPRFARNVQELLDLPLEKTDAPN